MRGVVKGVGERPVDDGANSFDGSDSESDVDPEPHPNAERASNRQRLNRENRRDLA